MGVDALLNVLGALEQQSLRIRPRQCSRLRHRRSTCSLCAAACPTGAITWEASLSINKEICSGCGRCAAVCPTGALECRNPAGPDLLARVREMAKESPAITFVCRTHLQNGGAPGGCQRVKCLGRLDESILVGAVAWGAKEVLLVDGSCGQCQNASIHGGIQKTVERSLALLQAFGVPARISLVADVPAGRATGTPVTSGVSRRDFFSLISGRARQTDAAGAEPILDSREDAPEGGTPKPGELPVYLPLKRRLLLAALGRLGEQASPGLVGEESFWTSVSFTTNCNGCRMCAVFCPTGALAKTEADGQPAVSFRSSHCASCLLCRDLCLWEAVRISPATDARSAPCGASVSTIMAQGKGPASP